MDSKDKSAEPAVSQLLVEVKLMLIGSSLIFTVVA